MAGLIHTCPSMLERVIIECRPGNVGLCRGRETPHEMLFQIPVPPMPSNYVIAVSPDGRSIVFVASSSGSVPSLFIREFGSSTPKQLEGTEGASSPFWSPDSRSIAFFAGGKLKRSQISGGPPRDICAVVKEGWGGTWNSEGVILLGGPPVLLRVSAAGGEPVAITSPDKSEHETAHVFPSFLPDGRHYLYTILGSAITKNRGYIGSLDSPEKIQLGNASTVRAAYADPGFVLFHHLFAQPFDIKKLALSGEAIRVADSVVFESWGRASWSASNSGILIYRSAGAQGKSQFVWFDRSGKQLGPAGEPGMFGRNSDLSFWNRTGRPTRSV
jgi:hypothetical protein